MELEARPESVRPSFGGIKTLLLSSAWREGSGIMDMEFGEKRLGRKKPSAGLRASLNASASDLSFAEGGLAE